MLPKDLPNRFFNPLTSKHREDYIHVLLSIELVLEQSKRIALPRNALISELRRIFQRENYALDVSDEDEYDEEPTGDMEQDNLAFTIRLFLRCGWVDIDESGDYSSDMLFITLYGKKLTGFIKDLSAMDNQTGHVVNIYSNLQQVHLMPDSGFVCIQNAHGSTERFLTSLEMMYSKIKKYYVSVIANSRPEKLLEEHLYGYVQDVIDKLIFPIKVDDSVDRFKGPILEALYSIESDTKLLGQIVATAVQTRRVESKEDGWEQVLRMLNYIKQNFANIESYIHQLDEKNQTYIRTTRQKLTYMLSMDTSVKGNIIAILRDAKERPDKEGNKLSHFINIHDIRQVTEESSRFKRKRRERVVGEDLIIEENAAANQDDVNSMFDTHVTRYTTANVNEYVKQRLVAHGLITAQDFPLEGDDDYLMAIFLAMNSTDSRCAYSYEGSDNVVGKGRYEIPGFTVRERG